MSECQFSSFYTFLMEPMIELEPERYTFSASSSISPQKLPPEIGELKFEYFSRFVGRSVTNTELDISTKLFFQTN